MKLKLATNIRTLRKERALTQEQLAEALGVTIGAVSKWESSTTTPELEMLMEIADFFEVSVDNLLGYQLSCGKVENTLEQIKTLRAEKRYEESIRMGEKALQKFPNHFNIIYQTALSCMEAGKETDNTLLYRAQELLRHALELIDQNEDLEISEWLIRNQIGETYVSLRQPERAVEIYKTNNINGINNARIAQVLSDIMKQKDAAAPYAYKAYRKMVEDMINTMTALNGIDENKKSPQCVSWLIKTLKSLSPDEGACESDKAVINFLQSLCETYLLDYNNKEAAHAYLKEAIQLAKKYDAIPQEQIVISRFINKPLPDLAYHDTGICALQMMKSRLHWYTKEKEPKYYVLWNEVVKEEGLSEVFHESL